jgi:diguanylate cyclase (GGDEF)-like protein
MKLANLRLRQLVSLVSIAMVICFLIFYFAFKYVWTHDQGLERALEQQQTERLRVQTVLEMENSELSSMLVNYASWSAMASYIETDSADVISDVIDIHTMVSNDLEGIFIYRPDLTLRWGLRVDRGQKQLEPYQDIAEYLQALVQLVRHVQNERIAPIVMYGVLNHKPYLVAASRVCNNDGYQCDHGYMIFIKPLEDKLLVQLQLATGIPISMTVLDAGVSDSMIQKNISIIREYDALSNSTIEIKISHLALLPRFIYWQELVALAIFAILIFLINTVVVNILIRPINAANEVLEKFQDYEGKLPDEGSFVSKEMKGFAREINRIVSELETSRNELKWQSEHDPLTHLHNRRSLQNKIHQFIETERYAYLTLFLLDIDHFKLFNDRYGHSEGDNVLKQVADALNVPLCDCEKIVSRYGGEEFCIVCASDEPLESEHYAQTLLNVIEDLGILHQDSFTKSVLSISIGGVIIHQPDLADYAHFFTQADKNLYQAKADGRDRYILSPFEQSKE